MAGGGPWPFPSSSEAVPSHPPAVTPLDAMATASTEQSAGETGAGAVPCCLLYLVNTCTHTLPCVYTHIFSSGKLHKDHPL